MVSYGIRRAINEIHHVLKSQWKNGTLPQIRFLEGQEGYSPDAEWYVRASLLELITWTAALLLDLLHP